MKSYLAIFVLITLSFVLVESKENLKNSLLEASKLKSKESEEVKVELESLKQKDDDKDKDKKKIKGPKTREEFNEIPFYRSNQKYTNHTIVDIDTSKIFALNFTYPQTHPNGFKSEFTASNNEYAFIKDMEYFFTNDCPLARLKITMTFPLVSSHGTGTWMVLFGIFLDGRNVGASIYHSRMLSDEANRGKNQLLGEPVVVTATIYNVLPKQHVITVGLKSWFNTYFDSSPLYSTEYSDANTVSQIEKESVENKVNLFMQGECLKYLDYN